MNNKFTVSVEKGSNKVISSSDDKFYGIGVGNLIKFQNSNELYTIIGKSSEFIIKEFDVQSPKSISINTNMGNKLQNGDIIKITYKNYECVAILDIIDNGNNYSIDEDIYITDGIPNVNMIDGLPSPTILTVKSVNLLGGITSLSIKNKGSYIYPPKEECYSNSKFNSKPCKISLKFKEKDEREVIEREIISINKNEDKTYLQLNYAMPNNILNGKFSVEKNYLILNNNFIGESTNNLTYQVYRDFTPEIKLPLMLRGSMSTEAIYNKAMQLIDSEISKIKNKIGI